MDLKAYIESGILELYVLNMLGKSASEEVRELTLSYPELAIEMEAIEKALENYALANAIEPPVTMKAKIEQVLFETARNLKAAELGPITEESDQHKWYNLVVDHFPDALYATNYSQLIIETNGLTQVLVVSELDIAEESHANEYESFLILKGKCRCTVDRHVFYLEPGGYTEIPLCTNHRVEVIEGPVMAIVQYRTAV